MAFAQIAALIFSQIPIFAPAFMQCFTLLRRQFANALVAFARLLTLFRRKPRPLSHPRLQSLLMFSGHGGVAFGDTQPPAALLRFKPAPFLFERRQRVSLL